MLQKIKNFFELRNLSFFVFILIAFSLSWSTVKIIQRNHDLQEDIAKLQEEVQLLELENANLKLNIEYYKTDEFLELEAREKFNKAAKGEKVILLPRDIDPEIAYEDELSSQRQTDKTSNFDAWLNFLLSRNQD